MVKTLIIRAPGTNCELETQYTFECAGSNTAILPFYRILKNPLLLNEFHIVVFPGGFSFGDYLGAGTMFALKLQLIKNHIISFLERKKIILGVCNGFQILVRAGLLPDWTTNKTDEVALTFNESSKFEARWIKLEIVNKTYDYMIKMQKTSIFLPVAHGEGRFITATAKVLTNLYRNNQVLFEYSKNGYPDNPNGSTSNIAGITCPYGQVIGLMPHPERFHNKFLCPNWQNKKLYGNPDGLLFIKSIVEHVKQKI